MGRFSSTSNPQSQPAPQQNIPSYGTTPYGGYGAGPGGMQQMSPQDMQRMQMLQEMQNTWPNQFPKPVVGLDRDGTIIQDMGEYITRADQVAPIPGSLEAIRMIRLKGHKLMILTNQGGIIKKQQTHEQVESVHQHLMQIFAEAGIFSIDGLYYSESSLKNDYFAKPNIGMFDRARKENGMNWKEGWYVGDSIRDLKAAERANARPVLVLTGHGEETLKKLDTFANRDLKKKTKVYPNLLEFAKEL